MKKKLFYGICTTLFGAGLLILGTCLSGLICTTLCLCGIIIGLCGLQFVSTNLKSQIFKNNAKSEKETLESTEYVSEHTQSLNKTQTNECLQNINHKNNELIK